jgi:hypothetical protein
MRAVHIGFAVVCIGLTVGFIALGARADSTSDVTAAFCFGSIAAGASAFFITRAVEGR